VDDTEKRLRIYRAITSNPEWVDILQDALALQEKKEAEYVTSEYPWLGFEWFEVHADPQTLKKMVTSRILNITFSSRTSTHYKVADPDLVREAIQALCEPAAQPESEVPGDLFDSIVGYTDVKRLIRYALEAERPTHLLLSGPPASAKTMFLLELRRLPYSYYALAATLTASGLADILFVYKPKFILIDEIERLSSEHIGVLNSLMATGIVSETKYGKTRQVELDTRAFAAGIKVEKLPQDLLSRFTKLHFPPYTEQEFIEVSLKVLTLRENTSAEDAAYIAKSLWRLHGQDSDIRQCVQIARLSQGDRRKIDEVLAVLKKYGFGNITKPDPFQR
jgi:Holliday junction DNA helicase RuvB